MLYYPNKQGQMGKISEERIKGFGVENLKELHIEKAFLFCICLLSSKTLSSSIHISFSLRTPRHGSEELGKTLTQTLSLNLNRKALKKKLPFLPIYSPYSTNSVSPPPK